VTEPTRASLPDVHRRWEDEVLPALTRYTTIPCLSPAFDDDWEKSGHLAAAAALLAGWAEQRAVHGKQVEVVAPAGRTPVVVVDAPATGGAPGTVIVYGHLDKQPPLGGWRDGLGPFTPVREGDRLYGRGTADDGYSMFAAMTALELLDAAGAPRPRVVVLIEASEESGSPDLPEHLDALAPRLGRPGLVVCLDSGSLTYDRLWLTTSLRGNLVMEVAVQVLTQGVHSGNAGGIVPTSFRLLRQLLDRLEDPGTGEVRVPELRAEIPESHRSSETAGPPMAETFPVVPGLELEGTSDADRILRRAWAPALAVTGMDGIPAVRDGGNVLRSSTTAKVSLRLPPSVDAAAAAGAIESLLTSDPPSGASVRVTFETPASGWVAPPFADWVTDAFTLASMETLGRPPGSLGEGGSIPFLAMLAERYPGAPLVATGVLGPGSNEHGPNEHLYLPMAEAVTVATARLVEAAANARL
jgi:acetylornithine deacetylase/succinyl-diaminopimelate desuccinylase-like protein